MQIFRVTFVTMTDKLFLAEIKARNETMCFDMAACLADTAYFGAGNKCVGFFLHPVSILLWREHEWRNERLCGGDVLTFGPVDWNEFDYPFEVVSVTHGPNEPPFALADRHRNIPENRG
jgi:hypothetical protein